MSRRTNHFRSPTGVLEALVRVVAAVVGPVADKALVDALGVVALEVILLAVDGATGLGLVAAILAVTGAVTVPGLGDANA